VVQGQNTSASVNFQPFGAAAPVFPDTFWIGTQLPVNITAVPGAVSYRVEWSPDPTFPGGGTVVPTSTLSVQITVPAYNVYFVRIRAVDPFGATGVPSTATRIRVVQAGPARQLVFTAQPTPPGWPPAGVAITPGFAVVAQDSLGNMDVTFGRDVTLAITAGTGTPGTVLQGATTETAAAGVATFGNVIIDSAGVGYRLTATATGVNAATSATFNIVPRLVFLLQPLTTLARGTIPPVQVVAKDGVDHTVTGFTDAIALAISSGSGTTGATLSGTVQQPADTGVATFTDLSIDALGTDYTLMATAATGASYGGAAPAQSVGFNVTLQLVFAMQPSGAGNFGAFTPAVQVAAHNGLGATEQTFLGDIALSIVPGTGTPGATLVGTTTVTAASGVATFANLAVDLPGAGYRLAAPGNPLAGLLGDTSAAFDIACATDCWTPVAALPTARASLGVGVVNGILYAIGGLGAAAYDTVEAYDPGTNTWTPRASMSIDRQQPGVGVVNGQVVVVGGFRFSQLASVEAYDPGTNTWAPRAAMPTARSGLGVGVINGILYAVGGYDGTNVSAALEAYDPVADTWSTKTPMDSARNLLGVGVINGILYAVGGGSSVFVEAYDPMSNSWSTKSPMLFPQVESAVGVLGGKLYVVGGYGGSRVEVYDPQTNTWTEKAALPAQRVDLGIGVVNGLLYAVGGSDGMTYVPGVDAYHP
jgi:N-acetylneuraminic acid mutarotase